MKDGLMCAKVRMWQAQFIDMPNCYYSDCFIPYGCFSLNDPATNRNRGVAC